MEEGKRVVRQYEMSFKLGAVELVEKQGYSVVEAGRRRQRHYTGAECAGAAPSRDSGKRRKRSGAGNRKRGRNEVRY